MADFGGEDAGFCADEVSAVFVIGGTVDEPAATGLISTDAGPDGLFEVAAVAPVGFSGVGVAGFPLGLLVDELTSVAFRSISADGFLGVVISGVGFDGPLPVLSLLPDMIDQNLHNATADEPDPA